MIFRHTHAHECIPSTVSTVCNRMFVCMLWSSSTVCAVKFLCLYVCQTQVCHVKNKMYVCIVNEHMYYNSCHWMYVSIVTACMYVPCLSVKNDHLIPMLSVGNPYATGTYGVDVSQMLCQGAPPIYRNRETGGLRKSMPQKREMSVCIVLPITCHECMDAIYVQVCKYVCTYI